jgi:2-dehydropantoate 2-reductase
MKILIVGAGAVGQVYGWHLHAAGHDVTFFVKEKYRAEVAGGLVLHRLGYGAPHRQDWPQVNAMSSVAEVAAQRWDQVWLTLASDALRGELAAQVLGAVGDATVICLQPDLEDGDYVRARLAAPAQLVQGLITFISYQSPLPGKPGPEGVAYFLPPLAPGLFAGAATRVQSVVQALRAGGLAAKPVADFAKAAAGAPALLQPLIAALETNAWKLGTLPGSEALALGLAASREALAVAAREAGASTFALRQLLRPLLWRLLVPVSRQLLPLDLETYLHYHFSKVGVQTRLMLDTYVRLGQRHGLPVAALQRLRAALP